MDVEDGATASIDGNVFSGNGTDVLVGATGDVTSLTGNTLTGTQFIKDLNPSDTINATTDTFNVGSSNAAVAGGSLTPTEGYVAEDRITDYLDNASDGYVELNASTIYLAQSSETANPGALNRAVHIAQANNTIDVQAGSFVTPSQVSIASNLSIVGAGAGSTIITTSFDTTASGDSKGWFLVPSTTTAFNLSGVTLDGSGHNEFQGIRDYGTGSISNVAFKNIVYPGYAGTGLVAFGGVGPVNVTDSTFNNMGREGVLFYGAGTTGSFERNVYTGKGAGDHLDYAVELGAQRIGPD